jgi:pimeloyl-ACP methyl ester carboxylesterase
MARDMMRWLPTAIIGVVVLNCVANNWGQEPTVSDVTFSSEADGTPQKYVLLLPPSFDPDAPHDVLIALHGHGSDRWQFVKDPRDECRAARDVAIRHTMLYVSPDYRASTSWMGPAAEADMVQIIAEVKKKFQVARVFLCGGSMGGSASLTFAVLHPELVDGVVSMNGTANFLEYANFLDAIEASFGGGKAEIPLEYKKRSAEYWPERLTMPVAITASGRDTAVPPESVLRLATVLRALKRPILLIHRPDAGHVTSYADAVAALEFVMENIPPGVPRR